MNMHRFPNTVRVSGSDVGIDELNAIRDVFDRGYLGMGQVVSEFESELSDFFGRRAVCVSTGTSALHLAVQGAGIGQGDEVLVPSLTYVGSYQAISATGAKPVSVDILPDSMTIDPEDLERKICSRSKAVMPVYYGGGISRLSEIRSIASTHNLRIIEDAAHAFGSNIGDERVGSAGDVSCFSFDPIKNLTSGEGGCVVSSDDDFLERVRDARLLGVQGDSSARNNERRLYEFQVKDQGWRYHMSNVNAAIGRAQFAKFSQTSAYRQDLAVLYDSVLAHHPNIETLPNNYSEIVPHIYVVKFPSFELRELVKTRLLSELNVETALHWYPNHLLEKFRNGNEPLPNTESLYRRMLTLPLHTKLAPADVEQVAHFVADMS